MIRLRSLPLAGLTALLLFLLAGAVTPAEAQFGKKLKNALKQNAEDKAVQAAVGEQNKAIDAAASGGGPDSAAAPAAPPAPAAGVAASDAPAAASGSATAAAPATGAKVDALKPGEGAWANYDFKPGDRVLYVDDFTGDEVGDFPKRMEFKSGALEIVEWQGTRYLRAGGDSKFYVNLPEILPERFTMEFDYTIPTGGEVWVSFGDENKRVQFGGDGTAAVSNGAAQITANGRLPDSERGALHRARVLADGKYVKAYLDDTRIINVPNADVGRSKQILFYTDGDAKQPTMFGNFRIAAGGKKLYDALAATGRVATQGIYFDTGSDRIRPESSPTLKEIGAMMKDHADLKLTIEGHTDNVGTAATNQALSEKRAAAVRQALVDTYQVDGARLTAKGLGQTKPAASNDTPEGRQSNRRVELVRQ
jgi:outer membrane protein OmpA-like peptidoglycan-associated protein